MLEAPGPRPSAKAASSSRILGDVDNTGGVDFFDALLVALYSQDARLVLPNDGDITLGDVNAEIRAACCSTSRSSWTTRYRKARSVLVGPGLSMGPTYPRTPKSGSNFFHDHTPAGD